MKKRAWIIPIILVLTAAVAAGIWQSGQPPKAIGTLMQLKEGVWPDNDYTKGIPRPEGEVVRGWIDLEKGYCYIQMTAVPDPEGYLELLTQEGFEQAEGVSEEVSSGYLMTKGEKSVSISWSGDQGDMGLYISNQAVR